MSNWVYDRDRHAGNEVISITSSPPTLVSWEMAFLHIGIFLTSSGNHLWLSSRRFRLLSVHSCLFLICTPLPSRLHSSFQSSSSSLPGTSEEPQPVCVNCGWPFFQQPPPVSPAGLPSGMPRSFMSTNWLSRFNHDRWEELDPSSRILTLPFLF